MSPDTFEDQLRSLLHDTADAEGPAYVDVDPNAVVMSGRRVLRRRRLATGAGIAAAVVALGGVGVATLTDGVDRTSDPAVSTSVPTATGPVSVDLTRTADVGDAWGRPDGRASVRVTVDPKARTWTNALIASDGSVSPQTSAALRANPLTATWSRDPGAPGLVVGLLPAAAVNWAPVWVDASPASTQDVAAMPGTGLQAFALWHEGGASTQLAGLDWTDGQRVYTTSGAAVPSERVGDEVVFVDQTQGLMGIFGPGSSSFKELRDTPDGQQPSVMRGVLAEGSTMMESSVLVLLPAGATRVDVKPAPGATLLSTNAISGGSTSGTLLVTRLRMPEATPGTGVDRVTWTNPDGTTASSKVG